MVGEAYTIPARSPFRLPSQSRDFDVAERRDETVGRSAPEFLAADADAGRRDDDLVVALLDDVAVDLAGDLLEFVGDALDGGVLGSEARDVGDHEVAVVDGVLDGDHVLLSFDLGDVDLHRGAVGRRVEVVEVEFDVVLGGVGVPLAEDLAHKAHRHMAPV